MPLTERSKIYLQYSIVLLPYLLLLVLPFANGPAVAWPVAGTFFLIVLCATAGIIHDPAPYSINKIYWIFNLIFFGLVPTYQFRVQHMAWGQPIKPGTFLFANGLILAGFAIYALVRWLVNKRLAGRPFTIKSSPGGSFINNYRSAGNIIFILCCVALVSIYGVENLWFRRMADTAALQLNSTLFLLADKVLRGAVMYFALLSIWLYRKGDIKLPQLLWVLAACIVVNFPLSVPRYFAATLYISLLITAGFRILRNRYFFSITLIALILFLFPVWGITRMYLHDSAAQLKNIGAVYSDALTYGDFDAYTSLCRTIEYVQAHGTTHGYQLLGVLLFFVPRSIWPSKPVGSGALVYDPIGVGFRNIASPFFAEGYINFGIAGTLCFLAVLAFTVAYYDRFYQAFAGRQHHMPLHYLLIFYPVAMIMVFFVLRGDLLSSFAYLSGFFVSGLAFHMLLRIKRKN